jgi:histone deacetylase HOS3
MSRHQRKVPVSFYHRFARDAKKFAHTVAKGRLISILEGGYSDRALTSGVIAHLSGLVDDNIVKASFDWWSVENLIAVSVIVICPQLI